ncbi:MAG TPA: uracil-DNA glycosylase [Anaerolineae bacterium]|nr:uracil-DNA glycosylase [Anaerolineae bacterium]
MSAQAELEQLAAAIRTCQQCPLARLRTHAVPGEGPADAEIMLIGEAPGFYEDKQGRPFVGASGQLLEKLLAGIGLSREEVFITNVVKCRPPANRDPLPAEIDACLPWLKQQIAIIDPLLIITLGRFSMAQFFPPSARITRVHGQPLMQDHRAIIPMFHPAAALRNPVWMREMEADFARIPALLETLRAQRAARDQDDAGPKQLRLF